MNDILVTPIRVESACALRQLILRPGTPLELSSYPTDFAATTLHLGAFSNGSLCGIASLYSEAPPRSNDPNAWRLRDLGVLEAARRQGCGRTLLQECFLHVNERAGSKLWCNARATAVPFYLAHQFQMHAEAFDMPGFGKRFFMWRVVRTCGREKVRPDQVI